MARYGVDVSRSIGIRRVVVVVGHGADLVREAVGGDVEYVEQADQRGTGHAVLAARPALEGHTGEILVLQADNALITNEAAASILQHHRSSRAAATLLTASVDDPGAYGRVLRAADGSVDAIAEVRGALPEVVAVREINAGAYVFDAPVLWDCLAALRPDATTGELYLTDVIRLLVCSGRRVEAVVAGDPTSALSVNDRVELAQAAAILRGRVLREHMVNGVTLEDPATTYIDADVRIGSDTVIRPMTWLSGRTVVGEECEIGPSVRITDCTLGDGVSVQFSVLAGSEVGDGTRIGPFAQLRPGNRIGSKVKIGNFVELKNAALADGVSAGHLAYIGDAFVGEKTNIGAGTITCNYDGKKKHVTRIGPGAFVGSHSTLVAPVEVGEGAYTAAGTVVTQDVPPDALAIGRAAQTNKPGWARRKRELRERE